MGGLSPRSGSALLKIAPPGGGTLCPACPVGVTGEGIARATEEHTMQDAQVLQ